MLVLAVGFVVAIIFLFNDKATSLTESKVGMLTAGDKIQIAQNPNWQNEIDGVTEDIQPISTSPAESSGTLTDNLSVSLMSNYLSMKQSGTFDSQKAQNLLDSSLQYFDSSYNLPVKDPSFTTISDNGKQSIQKYGEDLGTVFKANTPAQPKNEIQILTAVANSRSTEKLAEIDEILSVYNQIEVDLTKVSVPATFTKSHYDMIKGLRGIVAGLTEMKGVASDPIKSLVSVKTYRENVDLFQNAYLSTRAYIYKQNIFYKQGSGGYYLLYGI